MNFTWDKWYKILNHKKPVRWMYWDTNYFSLREWKWKCLWFVLSYRIWVNPPLCEKLHLQKTRTTSRVSQTPRWGTFTTKHIFKICIPLMCPLFSSGVMQWQPGKRQMGLLSLAPPPRYTYAHTHTKPLNFSSTLERIRSVMWAEEVKDEGRGGEKQFSEFIASH